jgi:hypothetical protein
MLCLTLGKCFRYNIAKTKPYKGNRKGEKPKYFNEHKLMTLGNSAQYQLNIIDYYNWEKLDTKFQSLNDVINNLSFVPHVNQRFQTSQFHSYLFISESSE